MTMEVAVIETPLVDGTYLLEKFAGKGGWTFARLPEIEPDKSNYFNWVRVRGSIDGYEIKGFNLMPMGNGQMFFSVKAEIRKIIKKGEGDHVHIILFDDKLPSDLPAELHECLSEVPNAVLTFEKLSEADKRVHIDYIYKAKTEQEKADRIVELIEKLSSKPIKSS
jgi:hypothetical protein